MATSAETVIEAKGLVKTYGAFHAVDGLNLLLKEGEVYGFLGPNGSGKSTTILMLLGLTEPTAGAVQVLGHDPTRDPLSVKRYVGYLPENVGFYGDLTGRDNLRYTAELNNIPEDEAKRRIERLVGMVELTQAQHQPVSQYSRGMRQRLGLADVLLKEPKIIVLDDPTLGLDPAGIQWFLGMIDELSSQRRITILLSSHQLQEVQRVCDRVGIMSHGKLVLEGTVQELTAQTRSGGFHLTMQVHGGKEGLRGALASLPGVRTCEQRGDRFVIQSDRDVRAMAATTVVAQGGEVLELQGQGRTLEEIYLRYFQED